MEDIEYYYHHFPRLETERLILRKLTAYDVHDIKKYSADDRLYTYWGRRMSYKERDPSEMFRTVRKDKQPDCIRWGIEVKSTHEIIGEINLFNIQNSRMGEIGYRIAFGRQGRGYCSEGVKRIIKFCFEDTSLQRLELRAMSANEASNRVAVKCGFIKEGTIRQGKFVHMYANYNLYGLLRSDLYPNEEPQNTKDIYKSKKVYILQGKQV